MSEHPFRIGRIRRAAGFGVLAALALTLLLPGVAQAADVSPSAGSSTAGNAAPIDGGTPVPKKPATQRATFGLRPATKGHADDRLEFTYQIGPGGGYSDSVELENYSTAPLAIQVLSADLGNTDSGELSVGLKTEHAVDLGAWIALPSTASLVTVARATAKGPGRVQIPFQLKIPTNATPGDHSAAIVAVLSTLGKNSKGQNVRLDQRVASRVFVRVPGPLHPQLKVDALRVSYSPTLNPFGHGVVHATYTIHNLGNTRLGVKQAVSVGGWLGLKASAPAVADIPLLLPGRSATVAVTVPSVQPAGHERLAVKVTPLVLDGDKALPVAVHTAGSSFWAVPWTLLALIVVLIALVVLVLRRRGRPRPPAGRVDHDPRTPSGPETPNGSDSVPGHIDVTSAIA